MPDLSVCFHEMATCNWICADSVDESSLIIRWKDPASGDKLKVVMKGDWRRFDAMTLTPAAYDQFAHPAHQNAHPATADGVRNQMLGKKKHFPDQPPPDRWWKPWKWF